MQRGSIIASVLLVACGNDTSPLDDVATSLAVTVVSPNGGETFADTQPVSIAWLATAETDSLACDVVALDGATAIPIATMTASTAHQTTMAWTPPHVAAPTPYRIQVTVHDASGSASDTSDSEFSIAPPPPAVSFAAQIQPILDASCTASTCHGGDSPLHLSAGEAYASLVGVGSSECTAYDLVSPAEASRSYLLFKLAGNGPCFADERMPRGEPALAPAEIELVRDWIMNGAPDN